jgi:hypothetical protein
MESLVIIGIISFLGYTFKTQSEEGIRDVGKLNDQVNSMPELERPNSTTMYESNKVEAINDQLLEISTQNYNKSNNPGMTGILPPIYNSYSVSGKPNNVSNANGVSWDDLSKISDINKRKDVLSKEPPEVSNRPMFKQILYGQDDDNEELLSVFKSKPLNNEASLLTGLPIQKDHANMVPFFGSNVKQNVESFTNTATLDNFTGNTSHFKNKVEVGPLFSQVKQDITSNGKMSTPAYTETVEMDRYIPSKFHQGEKLAYEERVAAPIGFTLDNPITKAQSQQPTIDQFRIGNKTQVTYDAVANSGQFGNVRGIHGKFNKNKVDTYFEMGQDKLFTAVGEKVAPASDYNYTNIQPTTRQSQNLEYYGTAAPDIKAATPVIHKGNVEGFEGTDSEYKQSTRQQLRSDYARGIGSNVPSVNDFGKSNYNVLELERDTTNQMNMLNVNANSANTSHFMDKTRTTGKESISNKPQVRTNLIGNKRTDSEAHSAGVLGNNIRDTQKESLVENKYKGHIQGSKNAQVYSTFKDPKLRYASHAENYTGAGSKQTGGEQANRLQYKNANISNTKEIAVSGQHSGNANAGASGGIAAGKGVVGDVKSTGNMLLKERDVSYIGLSNNTKSITDKSLIGNTQQVRNSNSEIARPLNGDLASDQLKNNPFYNIKRTF